MMEATIPRWQWSGAELKNMSAGWWSLKLHASNFLYAELLSWHGGSMFWIYLLFSYVSVYERLSLVNHAFSTLFLVLAHLVVALLVCFSDDVVVISNVWGYKTYQCHTLVSFFRRNWDVAFCSNKKRVIVKTCHSMHENHILSSSIHILD